MHIAAGVQAHKQAHKTVSDFRISAPLYFTPLSNATLAMLYPDIFYETIPSNVPNWSRAGVERYRNLSDFRRPPSLAPT